MANDISYLGLAGRAEELNVGENFQAELDVSARAGLVTSETSELFLTNFDPKLNIIVASDARAYVIGLMDRKNPLHTRLELYCQLKKSTARSKKKFSV